MDKVIENMTLGRCDTSLSFPWWVNGNPHADKGFVQASFSACECGKRHECVRYGKSRSLLDAKMDLFEKVRCCFYGFMLLV